MDDYQFSESELDEIWEEALFISHDNESKGFRQDEQGNWIRRSEQGNQQSEYGWLPLRVKTGEGLEKSGDFIPAHWKYALSYNQPKPHQYRLKLLPAENFNSQQIQSFWDIAHKHSSDNEQKGYRVDIFGHWVGRKFFGDANSPFGWGVVLVDDINDMQADKNVRMLPINLHLIYSLMEQVQPDKEGWTAWDAIEHGSNIFELALGAIGSAMIAPFSIFD